MNSPETASAYLDPEIARTLQAHENEILQTLIQMERSHPEDEVIQEINRLGGIGMLGITMDRITDMAEGNAENISETNARHVVAFMNSHKLREFIVGKCKSRLTETDLQEIGEAFTDYL